VVLAHPERSPGLLDAHRTGLDHELSEGSALQLNAFSLTGAHGDHAQRTALQLVELGLATAIASDAHGGTRSPALTLAYEAMLAHGIARGVARSLVESAPRRLMARGLARVATPLT